MVKRHTRLYLLALPLLLTTIVVSQESRNVQYNITWNSQSKNASESMPCGGGDIGMNVWVENGEVLIYVARSGSYNEDNAMLKSGRIRLKLSPNPFNGKVFKQELHLQEGYVTIDGESNGIKATVRIWADVTRPVAHIDIESNKKIHVEAGYENWRHQDRIVKPRENFGNSWKWAAPRNNVYNKDIISFKENGVLFYHHNTAETIFDATVSQQGMDRVKDQLYNPLKHLASGGLFTGGNFIAAGNYEGVYVNTDYKGWRLRSASASRQHSLNLFLHTSQVNDINTWERSLDSLINNSTDNKKAFAGTREWWRQFWNRSFIRINETKADSKAWRVGRNFQLFRYMLACNVTGMWPTKFNGGLLTVDPVYTDSGNKLTPDYRNWGGGLHTMQNQRLVYFPMIRNGDWDMLQSQLEFYIRIRKNAELRSKVYWNHAGACFTEQMENYGLPDYAEYGQDRPDYFDRGVEYNAWLEYEWDTVLEFCLMMLEEERYTGRDITARIPFIESCLRFFDEHYQYLAKRRGIKPLDGDGKLILYPGSGAETYKMANNATSTIEGLRTIATRTLEWMNTHYSKTSHPNQEQRRLDSLSISGTRYMADFLGRLPSISFQTFNGRQTIAPAKSWERVNNVESPQLYPVFPWGRYGLGKPDLEIALNTWKYDTNVIKFRSHLGWKQDNIWAARLGLTDDAWKLTSMKLENSGRRFPAFWGPGFDWVPDHNWGGSGMIGLQEMLMQTDDKKILLLPAWPKELDVHFKLHAPYNTTVEAEWKGGKLVSFVVSPEERKKDVKVMIE